MLGGAFAKAESKCAPPVPSSPLWLASPDGGVQQNQTVKENGTSTRDEGICTEIERILSHAKAVRIPSEAVVQ